MDAYWDNNTELYGLFKIEDDNNLLTILNLEYAFAFYRFRMYISSSFKSTKEAKEFATTRNFKVKVGLLGKIEDKKESRN